MNAIEWLKHLPQTYGERPFLIDAMTGRTMTFSDIDHAGRHAAGYFRGRGLTRGDRVAFILHNSSLFAELYFGCLYGGCIAVPINPTLTRKEVQLLLEHSHASLVVVSAETFGHLDPAWLSAHGDRVVLLADGRSGAIPTGFPVLDAPTLSASEPVLPFDGVGPDDTMCIVYTSGTTARPVGVVHRIADLIDNARVFSHRVGLGPNNRFLGILAMTYLGGYYNLLMLPYVAGSSVVLTDTFHASSIIDFWRIPREHGVDTLWLVPTICSILMEMDRGREGESYCRSSVRTVLAGTAPLPVKLRRDFEARYGVRILENYGLSETTFITTNAPTLPDLDGCVGRLLPGVQVTILDAGGAPVPYGEEGEIHVCTPFLMKGSLDPETGALVEREMQEWFPTGDIGILMQTGDLFITGRKKDLIIRGGINISPAAVENLLHQHAAVVECAVVGIPHPMYGEDVAAVVRLREGSDANRVMQELSGLCKAGLAPEKRPARLLELEEFPKSATGKIQKRRVREILMMRLGLEEIPLHHRPREKAPMASRGALPGRVRRAITRPDARVVEILRQFSPSIISDCMNRMGIMHADIRLMGSGARCCGPAVTVEEAEGCNLMSHIALEVVQRGDVLVIDAKGIRSRAAWGGVQTLMAEKLGLAGIVINGMVRDLDEIRKRKVPVFALGTSPGGPLKGWGGNVNSPVSCGGVAVNPGDIISGDEDGIVVVPAAMAESLIPLCERRVKLEAEWIQRVERGEGTMDAVGLREMADNIGIQYE
ncbi:MAG TPA: AMP-binding protein [Candidatus Ozemobacteraceae bacterium]|nr:AMP-binding protein [Candidatus Ozemobacteraceae bacterium]